VQHPPRDLTTKKIADLDDLGNASTKAYGAKAANVGELRNVLPEEQVPDGFGIPFSFYDTFMKKSGLYDEATRMMADPRFKSDAAYRERKLDEFRERIEDAPVPPALKRELTALQAKFPEGSSIRCRSSTNNEDLPGFNGAGLYDSYTHRPDEGTLDNTVKQVWASLWNFRAYEEREFYRIPHMEAAMGVLVHPNFDDEKANGVAVTKNIYDPNWPGFYVNVQVGEELVTNPTGGATPDEFLISAIGEHGEYETQFVRHSNQTRGGKPVLTKAQTAELTEAMEKIQAHFKKVYKAEGDAKFAMDIEFKIGTDGHLVIKQARPMVE
jgi:phosphoenolpyruvate synthase/pyruvate phosphate dikinase